MERPCAQDRELPELDLLLVARHRFGGCPPLGDWQMARALGTGHRVLYVEPPRVLRRVPGARPRGVDRRPGISQAGEGLHVFRPTVLPGASRRATAPLNDRLLWPQLARASRAVFADDPVLLSFDPLRGTLDGVPRSAFVYWRRDSFADLRSRTAALLARREKAVMAAADLVSCVSGTLVAGARRATSRTPVVLIPNGCDFEHFSLPRPRPPGFPAGRPVLGFVGGSFWRLDGSLIAGVADARPDWTLLLVGDTDHPVPRRPNILRRGYVEYQQIPAWMQHLDVAIIPYDQALEFNRASFPLKALEHLAAGVPVVSTAIPSLQRFTPHIRTATGVSAFVAAVEQAIDEGPSPETCREIAAANSWTLRAEALVGAIRGAVQRP